VAGEEAFTGDALQLNVLGRNACQLTTKYEGLCICYFIFNPMILCHTCQDLTLWPRKLLKSFPKWYSYAVLEQGWTQSFQVVLFTPCNILQVGQACNVERKKAWPKEQRSWCRSHIVWWQEQRCGGAVDHDARGQ
jgi:hypothetical protein